MLVHSHNSMSGTWPHDRLGPQEWSNFGSEQDLQAPSSTSEGGTDSKEHQEQSGPRPQSPTREESIAKSGADPMDVAPLPSLLAQNTSTTAQNGSHHRATPSINVSSETPLPSCEQSESMERGDDEIRSMELDGSTIDEDEEISEGPGDGETNTNDKNTSSSYIDKRKMKRFR